jgi:hypothetical protein
MAMRMHSFWLKVSQGLIDGGELATFTKHCRIDPSAGMSDLFSAMAALSRQVEVLLPSVKEFECYEATATAMEHLLTALDQDFDFHHCGASSSKAKGVRSQKSWQKALDYQAKRRRLAEQRVQEVVSEKVSGRIAHIWFCRVGLADPAIPAATLEQVAQEFGATEEKQISHTYIGAVKDCFCEIIKEQRYKQLTGIVQVTPPSMRQECGALKETMPFFLGHVHDEASMRMRSFGSAALSEEGAHQDSTCRRVVRGRTSKVQNHVLTIQTGTQNLELYTELQPLQNKTADTIGHALIAVTSKALQYMMSANSQYGCTQVRVVHLLTGDGIATNQAAARRVAYRFLRQPVQFQAAGGANATMTVRYSVCEWPCASHCANLCVQVAICGHRLPGAKPNADSNVICAATTRFYKYLQVDYSEEFYFSMKQFVLSRLDIAVQPGNPEGLIDPSSSMLQSLYGKEVLPDELVWFFNGSLDGLRKVVGPDADVTHLPGRAVDLVTKYILFLDERPTPSRFWTFAECVYGLLRMKLMNIPAEACSVHTKTLQPENQKRLKRLRSFYNKAGAPNDPGSGQLLREAALALQLTCHACSISAKKFMADDNPIPTLVRLGKGEVQLKISEQIQAILPKLSQDPQLDQDRAFQRVFDTSASLIIHFAQYLEFPTRLWELTSAWNPSGFAAAIEDFLELEPDRLDVGYSLQLQQDAFEIGGRPGITPKAIAYLMSTAVQDELTGLFKAGCATSLDVERKNNCDKRAEGRRGQKVKGIARASRDSILQRYRTQKVVIRKAHLKAAHQLTKVKHMNPRSLAIKKHPELFARGRGRLRNVAGEDSVTSEMMKSLTSHGDETALQKFIYDNAEDLKKELHDIKQKAKDQSAQTLGPMPYSNQEWVEWLQVNDSEFRQKLKEATSARKVLGCRLLAQDLPALPRLRPQPLLNGCALSSTLLHCRPGFAAARADAEIVVFFFTRLRARVWAALLDKDLGYAGRKRYLWDGGVLLSEQLKPLEQTAVLAACTPPPGQNICDVWSLEPHIVSTTNQIFSLEFHKASEVNWSGRAAAAVSDEAETDEVSELFGKETARSEEEFDDLQSDPEMVASELETDADTDDQSQLATESGSSSADESALPRAPRGTYVVFHTPYSYLIRHAFYCKMALRPRWLDELGRHDMSKALTIKHHDTHEDSPVRTMIALKAWMLGRTSENDFHKKKRARVRWWESQLQALRREVCIIGADTHSTGSATTDALIRQWCPRALE